MANYKRIYRSRTESMVAGLAGGLAEYFRVDPVLVRLGFVAACVLTDRPVIVTNISGEALTILKSGPSI